MSKFIVALLHSNDLVGADYLEPYAGGAGVALSLLVHGHVSTIHINDLDVAIYSFWHSVLNDTERLCRLIVDTKVTVEEWHRQRDIHADKAHASKLDLGFSTFFLNRTNRSGIICSGGMIGGQKQSGDWSIDARFNKSELVHRIERIAGLRHKIRLHNKDAEKLMRKLIPKLPQKSLVYLDPPYYIKGQRRLYANSYSHDDHACIAELIQNCPRPWLVSYDDRPEIRALYRKQRTRKQSIAYTARDRYVGREILIFCGGIKIPRSK